MSVVEGSTDTPIAFIIILGMERHICAVVFVVNYCTNSRFNQITLLNDQVRKQTVALLFFQPQCIISIINSYENVMNPKFSYTEWKWVH